MSGVYASAVQSAFSGGLDLTTGTITAYLVTGNYTPNYGTHSQLSDVSAGYRQADTALSNVSLAVVGTGVALTADSATFAAATGDPVTQVVIAQGNTLIACADSFGAGPGGTTVPLNGSDVTITWDSAGLMTIQQGS